MPSLVCLVRFNQIAGSSVIGVRREAFRWLLSSRNYRQIEEEHTGVRFSGGIHLQESFGQLGKEIIGIVLNLQVYSDLPIRLLLVSGRIV